MKNYKIAVLPGDGIGPEVMKEAIKVLDAVAKKQKLKFDYKHGEIGGTAYDKYGTSMPAESMKIAENSDAILYGSVGGPKWDNLPEEKSVLRVSLLNVRKHFKLFANLRPAVIYKPLVKASPLRPDIVGDGFDILIFRELTGGIYFGKKTTGKDFASDEMIYHEYEVERIAKLAFDAAMTRKKHVTCIDKSNVLATSIFFRKVVIEVAKDYPEVKLDFLFIDNATMQIIKRPREFDVIVTGNMFGDIISDEAAMLTGSVGMLASASLNEKGFGMYEPAGGSAPDIAGKGIANPIAQILSAAMMLKYSFKLDEAHKDIENAVIRVLEEGYRTGDIMEPGAKQVNTKEMGDLIASKIQ